MSGTSFLATMAAGARRRADLLRADADPGALARAARVATAPSLVLHPAFDLIAEVKLVSPSAGTLADDAVGLETRVAAYCRAGACAVSVLTEPERFGGSLDHLARAARTAAGYGVPVMAKDFMVAPEQVLEARAAGAGGVLVILRLLDNDALAPMVSTALELGMFVLLEAFDEADLRRMAPLFRDAGETRGRLLAGLNARDLATLEIETGRFARLAGAFPAGAVRVAESGLENGDDVAGVVAAGYRVALVGTALMRAVDPGARLAEMLAAGRGASA